MREIRKLRSEIQQIIEDGFYESLSPLDIADKILLLIREKTREVKDGDLHTEG